MTNEDFDFMLQDRIAKIKAINEQYDLEHNSYISFSGGMDSTILHHLIDIALPNNNIPRVYANTGIEYVKMLKYVKGMVLTDKRFIIVNQTNNIKQTLNKYGYPFKSKEFSLLNLTYWNMNKKKLEVCEAYKKRINGDKDAFNPVPNQLRYLFKELPFKISDKCCTKLKEDLLHKWQVKNNKSIAITGIRREEGGRRSNIVSCLTGKGTKFHPLVVITNEWENDFIKRYNVQLCELYYPPYNLIRTGCKGCPYSREIQDVLNMLYKLLPNEYYQCLHLWKPVYDEYIRIGYRLKYYPHEKELNDVSINYNK